MNRTSTRSPPITSQQVLLLPAMLSNARSRAAFLLTRRTQLSSRRAYAFSANDKQEINPNLPKEVPNVSKTNELPIETPNRDAPLQEFVEEAEKIREWQAPNRKGIWSRSQNPRPLAMSGPRFEQTIFKYQVCGIDTVMGAIFLPSLVSMAMKIRNRRMEGIQLIELHSLPQKLRLSIFTSSQFDGFTNDLSNAMEVVDHWATQESLSILTSPRSARARIVAYHT
jgi:hypothetical protein